MTMAQILVIGALGVAFGSTVAGATSIALAALAVVLVAGLAAVGK